MQIMENNTEQTIKGDENSQQNITNQYNNCNFGITEKRFIELIQKHFDKKIVEIVKELINSIKPENRKEPDKRIFVPLIQQLSYSLGDDYIKNTYKKLLQSSMDINKKTHPSFVSVISQLNSDEIKLISKFQRNILQSYPLIDIKVVGKNDRGYGTITIMSNFTNIAFCICEYPENVCSYIDNLERLKIINIPPYAHLTDKSKYISLKEHPFIKNFLINYKDKKTDFTEKCMSLTQFGVDFLNSCC